eukprot:TRINITY_DN866_c0_g1_i2.p2 TRINITY_DN866_c0_g1~~TRINITY_DN866_c0_g1_i2.p2  ORF type:complete len:225 (+),score=65.99 TRINITY_DN866_c0_g1_i2:687-1361(+)
MGHLQFGIHKAIPVFDDNPNTALYFSTLRDPMTRVISHYLFHLVNKKDPNHAFANDRTLEEWLNDVEFANNQMTLFFTGMDTSIWYNSDVKFNEKIDFRPSGDNILTKDYNITKNFYDLAINNLKNFIGIVGLQEYMSESISHYSYFLGFDISDTYKIEKVQTVKTAPVLTDVEIAKLKQRNHWDIKLYNLSKQIFIIQRSIIKVLEDIKKVNSEEYAFSFFGD